MPVYRLSDLIRATRLRLVTIVLVAGRSGLTKLELTSQEY
jgi:hypothetical protein